LLAEKKYPGDADAEDKLKAKITEGKGPTAHGVTVGDSDIIYTVSRKSIPDIFDRKLKISYRILISFGRIFLTQLAIK